VAAIASGAPHVLNRSFFIFKENSLFTHLADFFESFTSHESGVNRSGRRTMGLSEFPDILSPVILHFSGDISDGSVCGEISLIRHRRCSFFYFAFR
jgi:hypothetical protein